MMSSVDKTNDIARKDLLVPLFEKFNFFCKDVDLLIIQYDSQLEWNNKASVTWTEFRNPTGIISFEQNIYVASANDPFLKRCNMNGEVVQKYPIVMRDHMAMDIDKEKGLLYIVSSSAMHMRSLLNLNDETRLLWFLPMISQGSGQVKINNG